MMEYLVEFDIVKALITSSGNLISVYHEMMQWCEENCSGEFDGSDYSLATRLGKFTFELETDAMAFKLKWI